MKVVTITTFDDYKSGQGPTVIVQCSDNCTEESDEADEIYRLWSNKEYKRSDTLEELRDRQRKGQVEDAWWVHEVETVESLKP